MTERAGRSMRSVSVQVRIGCRAGREVPAAGTPPPIWTKEAGARTGRGCAGAARRPGEGVRRIRTQKLIRNGLFLLIWVTAWAMFDRPGGQGCIPVGQEEAAQADRKMTDTEPKTEC